MRSNRVGCTNVFKGLGIIKSTHVTLCNFDVTRLYRLHAIV